MTLKDRIGRALAEAELPMACEVDDILDVLAPVLEEAERTIDALAAEARSLEQDREYNYSLVAQRDKLIAELERERGQAIRELRLSATNENATRGDLVACVRDRMQTYVSMEGNYRDVTALMAEWEQRIAELEAREAEHLRVIREAEKRIGALERSLMRWEEREAAVCPEDRSFEEMLAAKDKRIAELEAQVEAMTRSAQEVAALHEPGLLREMEAAVRIAELEAALAEREQEIARLREDFAKFVADAEAVVEATAGAFALAHVHGMSYRGPQLDIPAAKAALARLEPQEDADGAR